ncbi:MAG: hypothetical protein GX092_00785 [Clostridia bacterium]|nr:hypothetical protein [Clostridia bacterium]
MMEVKCPVCGSRSVGKVGVEQYYCWDCYVEYQYHGNKARRYIVEEDGSLVEF